MIQLIYDTTYHKHFLIDTTSGRHTGHGMLLDFKYKTPADFRFSDYPSLTLVDSLPSVDDIKSKYPELFI